MINVPIFDLAGEISAPWIDLENFPAAPKYTEVVLNSNSISDSNISKNNVNQVEVDLAKSVQDTSISNLNNPLSINSTNNKIETEASSSIVQGPPTKKMKMVKKTRTFVENGYQMTEVVNELVPCDDENDPEAEVVKAAAVKPEVTPSSAATINKPKQQSSMMNFFNKK